MPHTFAFIPFRSVPRILLQLYRVQNMINPLERKGNIKPPLATARAA